LGEGGKHMEADMGKQSTGLGTGQNVASEGAMAQQGAQELMKEETNLKSAPSQGNLDFVLDIPMMLTVELGRSQMLINELLKLGRGSVIELSKLAGEPLDILANQRLIARGEVVVVNEKYGIRITEIISPAERVEKLK